MKVRVEKKMKKMEDKCAKMEEELKEKEKENKLQSIKMKEIIRSSQEISTQPVSENAPKWNYSTITASKKVPVKLDKLNNSVYESDPSGRSRSIEPQMLRLRARSKVDTNLKVSKKSQLKSKLK
jgi:hypothetical protein